MSFPTGSANPYESPAVDLSPVSLADDTEFLFNDKVVAGIGTISLPSICVISGETSNLVRRETRFQWSSRWLRVSRDILAGLTVVFFIQLLRRSSGPAPAGAMTGVIEMIPYLIGTLAAFAAIGFAIAVRLLRETVIVQWSISQRILRKVTFSWRIGSLSVVFGVLTTGVLVALGRREGNFWLPIVLFFGGIALSISNSSGLRPLSVLGRHNGLFLIGGFREPFLKEVQRLAALRSSRESGTATKPD
jgi:hypothetical protein